MKNNKKKKIILLIVIVVLLSLTARGALVYFEAKDVIKHYTDYRTETLNLYKNLNDCYNSEHSNSVEKAFYLSHQNLKVYEQDPLSVDLGFYSTVKNQKGESLAFSQPYILFEKNPGRTNSDIRILELGDEFTEEYNDLGFDSKRDVYNRRSIRSLEEVSGYGKGNKNKAATTVYVNGTCDDNFVYLEKLEWYDNEESATYTFTPKANNTQKGSVEFNEWLNTNGDGNGCRVDISSIRAVAYADELLNNEAEEICEQKSSGNNKTDGCCFEEGLLTSTIYLTKAIDDGDNNPDNDYVFSCVYVFHPLSIAVKNLSMTYWGGVIRFVAIAAIIAGVVIINKKSKQEYSFTDAEIEIED